MTKKDEKYHFIGIGGIGMSGLANILLEKKCSVQGSDIALGYMTEGLEKSGAKIFRRQEASNITPDVKVVISSDIKPENPEYAQALLLKCELLHRSDLLKNLMDEKCSLAVAGTHGKTTTSSLLTEVLDHADLKPTFVVGGILARFKTNARLGSSNYFVAEADESDGTFLKYHPFGAIVTNIDRDHMNYFKTESSLIESFKKFMEQTTSKEHLVWCGDDSHLRAIDMGGTSYGFTEGCLAKLSNFGQRGWSLFFDLTFQGKSYKNIEVALTGRHNALNAAAVFILSLKLGVNEETIRTSLKSFFGAHRRAEKKGAIHSIEFIDDYAHHPTEISATLKAMRLAFGPKRIIAIFQPHRYSRVQDLLGTFGSSFQDVDEVVLTDIYAAGEKSIDGVTVERLKDEIDPFCSCRYVPRQSLALELIKILKAHDVCITLGAGCVTKVSSETLSLFQAQTPRKLKVGVVCGGRSNEHEVSLLSVKNVLNQLKADLYDVTLFTITKKGEWFVGKEKPEGHITQTVIEKLLDVDVVFPVLHGPFGEDGSLQGFLETLGVPYVGCCHRSSAICMDKALTKKLASLHNVPTLDFVDFKKGEWRVKREEIFSQILKKLCFPVFVKPLHLGSTMGVFRVMKREDLENAIEKAFRVDTEILVENGLDHPREIEFSVLGNDDPIAYPPGEILTQGKVYSYEGKYSQGEKAMGTSPKSDLPPHLIEQGIKLAKEAYLATGCSGMARVDFFLDQNQKLWFNEINPIPGFTNNSLFPKMCEVNGLSQSDLMDRLIILAMDRFRKNAALLNVCYE